MDQLTGENPQQGLHPAPEGYSAKVPRQSVATFGSEDKGLTLIELLVVLAILAILAVGGISLFGLIPVSVNATSGTILKEAVRQLTVQALSDEGAEMIWKSSTGTLSIVALGANPVSKSYHLSPKVSITLDSKPFQCLVLNPQGFPDNSAVKTCGQSNPTIPMTWSVTDGSSNLTFQ